MISNGKEGMSKLKFAYDFLGTELHGKHRFSLFFFREIRVIPYLKEIIKCILTPSYGTAKGAIVCRYFLFLSRYPSRCISIHQAFHLIHRHQIEVSINGIF